METEGIKIEYVQQLQQWQISIKNEQGAYNYTGIYGKTLNKIIGQLTLNIDCREIIGSYKNANED